jgi:hypothetical protein
MLGASGFLFGDEDNEEEIIVDFPDFSGYFDSGESKHKKKKLRDFEKERVSNLLMSGRIALQNKQQYHKDVKMVQQRNLARGRAILKEKRGK